MGLEAVHAIRVFGLVPIDDDVAPVVVAFADQPAEDVLGVLGIEDFGAVVPPVQRRDVVAGDGAPVDRAGLQALPTLDAREQALDARAVAPHQVAVAPGFVDDEATALVVDPVALLVL